MGLGLGLGSGLGLSLGLGLGLGLGGGVHLADPRRLAALGEVITGSDVVLHAARPHHTAWAGLGLGLGVGVRVGVGVGVGIVDQPEARLLPEGGGVVGAYDGDG